MPPRCGAWALEEARRDSGGLRGFAFARSRAEGGTGERDGCDEEVPMRWWCRSLDTVGSRYCDEDAVPTDGLLVPVGAGELG